MAKNKQKEKELDERSSKGWESIIKNILACEVCGRRYVKVDDYTYRGNCKHIQKTWWLSVG